MVYRPRHRFSPSIRFNDYWLLGLYDIEIDELVPSESILSHEVENRAKEKKTEREKLFDGGADVKPRARTREEIEVIYRKTWDASSVAGETRNKLLERQQKLEKTRRAN